MSEKYIYTSYDNLELEYYLKILREKYRLNRKLLLVQVPQFQFESFNKDIARNKCYYAFPPTGLQCIAKSLENRNLEIQILDLNYELLKRTIFDPNFDYHSWISILEERLNRFNPSIIGTTCINVSKLFSNTN